MKPSVAGSFALFRAFVAASGARAGAAFALMIAGALTEGFSLALIVPVVALLTGQDHGRFQQVAGSIRRALGLGQSIGQLPMILALFVVAVGVRATILGLRDRLSFDLQLRFVDAQRAALVEGLTRSRWQDVAGLRHARVTQALAADIPRVSVALTVMLSATTALVLLAGQWMVLLLLAPAVAALALAAFVGVAAAWLPTFRGAAALGGSVRRGTLSITDLTAQLMGGLKLALSQNMQTAFAAEFIAQSRRMATRQRAFNRRAARLRTFTTIAAAAVLAGVIVVGTALRLPVATLIGAAAVFARMFGPGTTVLQATQQIAGLVPSYIAVRDLTGEMTASPVPAAATGPIPRGTIALDEVHYAHGGGEGGVRDISLVIDQGERVGVVGPSGAGKTTFVDLLCGLLAPDGGCVRVGGVALEAGALDAWRNRIAYIAQDSYLLHETIRRNLTWGIAPLPDAAIWAALEQVEAAGLVRRMPAGLDTMVGERGSRLSGGERQRLALARALLRAPDLLILDEASNAIDVPTEQAILERIAAIVPRITIVIVSQREETLAFCERILRFDAGRLVADRPAAHR